MNKEFAKKMIKAEMLRYEAFKEILPENFKSRVESFEKDAGDLLKVLALEILSENMASDKNGKRDTEGQKSAKKVEVDFS